MQIRYNIIGNDRQWFMKWFQYENWATAWQNQQNDLFAQRRLRSAWASAQSDQSQRCPPEAKLGPKLPTERSKCFFLASKYAAHIHFITFFTFHIEPNMKLFSHANNIVLRWDIYIQSLNWCWTDQTFLSRKRNMVCSNSAVVRLCKGRLRCKKCRFGQKGL